MLGILTVVRFPVSTAGIGRAEMPNLGFLLADSRKIGWELLENRANRDPKNNLGMDEGIPK